MKAQHLVVIAFAAVAGEISAQANEVDPDGRIEAACASDMVRLAAIACAVKHSRYP